MEECQHVHALPHAGNAWVLTCEECGAVLVPVLDTRDQVVLATITTDTELLDPVED